MAPIELSQIQFEGFENGTISAILQDTFAPLAPHLQQHLAIGGSVARGAIKPHDIDTVVCNLPGGEQLDSGSLLRLYDYVYDAIRRSPYMRLIELRTGLFEGELFIPVPELLMIVQNPSYVPQRYLTTTQGYQAI